MRFELTSNKTLRLKFKNSLYKRTIINVKAQTKPAFQGRNEHFYFKFSNFFPLFQNMML